MICCIYSICEGLYQNAKNFSSHHRTTRGTNDSWQEVKLSLMLREMQEGASSKEIPNQPESEICYTRTIIQGIIACKYSGTLGHYFRCFPKTHPHENMQVPRRESTPAPVNV